MANQGWGRGFIYFLRKKIRGLTLLGSYGCVTKYTPIFWPFYPKNNMGLIFFVESRTLPDGIFFGGILFVKNQFFMLRIKNTLNLPIVYVFGIFDRWRGQNAKKSKCSKCIKISSAIIFSVI